MGNATKNDIVDIYKDLIIFDFKRFIFLLYNTSENDIRYEYSNEML